MVCPVICHYNCVIRDSRWTCYDVISRVKSRFALSNYINDKVHGATLGRLYTTKPKYHTKHEQQLPVQLSITALSRDQEDIVKYFESDSSHEKPFIDDLIVRNGYYFRNEDVNCLADGGANFTERHQPVEEPWLLQPCATSLYVEVNFNAQNNSKNQQRTSNPLSRDCGDVQSSSNYSKDGTTSFTDNEKKSHQVDRDLCSTQSFSERDHPVEDPWLIYSILEPSENNVSTAAEAHITNEPSQDEANLLDDKEQRPQFTKKLPSGTESNLLSSVGSAAEAPITSKPTQDEANLLDAKGNNALFSRKVLSENESNLLPSVGSAVEGPITSEPTQDEASLADVKEQHPQISEKLLSGNERNPYPPMGSTAEAPITSEPTQDEAKANLPDIKEQNQQILEKLLSGNESSLLPSVDSISIEILINCSICTMQRIAVLEDGNLVELLLEPVKSNVQCDSVYLGVVTKLVPHMGGAFVNIGSNRPSLMDFKQYKEPYIFPMPEISPKDEECPPPVELDKDLDISKLRQAFLEEDDEHSDEDGEVDFEDDDFEEHVNEDDMDSEEAQTGNLTRFNNNGTGSNFSGSENHFDGNGKVLTNSHPSPVHRLTGKNKAHRAEEVWSLVSKGTKILVQVVKEGMGSKSPTLTPYPKLRSRFWVLITRCKSVGVSKKISGAERTRLKVIARSLQPPGFGVTIRTVAAGHSVEELRKDLEGLLSNWRDILENAKSAALAADEGVKGAVPVILHQAMGQTLSVVQDYFNEKVKRMVVDSPRTYHEVTNYLQDIAPELCDRVELHRNKVPLFDEFKIEEEINNILNKRVALPNGGSLVIEQTEALVSIDVNGGHGMFRQETSQEEAIVDVNLAAAKQIARELRLRDVGGIIVVDFIDMTDDSNKRLVYEEVKKAVERDRSVVNVSELSRHGLMEITRQRVRPSVTFMVSEPCTCCHGTGRIEALETSYSKIEHEICRLLATVDQKADLENPKSWPKLLLRVDSYMCEYLTKGKRTRLATLSSSLKVWILLKVARNFSRGAFEVKLLSKKEYRNHQHVGVATSAAAVTSIPTKRTKLLPVKKWKAARKL